ncbi:MAG TPA: DUF4956 domain-containing protein, partial [Herpetosiphonaceae bacterium]
MSNDTIHFLAGAGFNLAVTLLLVRGVYYPVTQDKNFVFTFLGFNTIIYFVLGLLTSVEVSVGVGFGLFAIFSLLRYRTDEIPIREMTYLFIVIALGVMNSMLMVSGNVARLLIANALIVAVLFVLERGWGFRFESSKKIAYDKIDLIVPERRDELLADLRRRTGLPVKRAEIGRIDFLHDMAELKVFYDEPRPARAASPATNALAARD